MMPKVHIRDMSNICHFRTSARLGLCSEKGRILSIRFCNVLIANDTQIELLDLITYTCRPNSSAKGSMYKSPTVETVAFPSIKDLAACDRTWISVKILSSSE